MRAEVVRAERNLDEATCTMTGASEVEVEARRDPICRGTWTLRSPVRKDLVVGPNACIIARVLKNAKISIW